MKTHPENSASHTDETAPSEPPNETSRRAALRSLAKVGLGAAAVGVPAFLGRAEEAHAAAAPMQEARSVTDVLNFALTLEFLERDYYQMGLDSGVIPAGEATDVYTIVRDHEAAHVTFLQDQLGADAVAQPAFDFTAGGAFDPFNDYPTFLLLSQAFEDTGVRAYKGQAPFLIDNDAVLTAALTIHSVEARHASKVRRIRGLQGWIPYDQPDAPAAVAPVYAGMDQTVKYDVNVRSVSGIGAEEITEAWDEPLSTEDVMAIVNPFLA